ncbi:hypothetical protein EVAR_69713_1 [Eumeta japonica]|uniref:Uncharacterized protein n=1 Tax=Eumeta variegata TaxID=151549 RepID=A0A4C1T8G2_EUMVA|nr:hypothetical protein EVAR_69713_1 [Eumeta japonica]
MTKLKSKLSRLIGFTSKPVIIDQLIKYTWRTKKQNFIQILLKITKWSKQTPCRQQKQIIRNNTSSKSALEPLAKRTGVGGAGRAARAGRAPGTNLAAPFRRLQSRGVNQSGAQRTRLRRRGSTTGPTTGTRPRPLRTYWGLALPEIY